MNPLSSSPPFFFLFLLLIVSTLKLQAQEDSSKTLLNQIIQTNEGDFNGLYIGSSRQENKDQLPLENLIEEDDYYLHYETEVEGNSYALDLYFELDRLVSIDAYLNFGTDANALKEADAFYQEMKTYFTEVYSKHAESYEEDEFYTYWYLKDRDIEVGVNEGEVYWYIIEYEELEGDADFFKEKRVFQEVVLKDVFTNLANEFLGIQLEDTRLEVISKLPKENFDDAGLHELFYYWELGTVDHYLDLYFSEQDVLEELQAYVYFYSETMEMDAEKALDFYYELITLFSDRYGNEYEANQYEKEYYIIWTLKDKGIEIGLFDNEVYWYFYDL